MLSTKERIVFGINPVKEVVKAKKKIISLTIQKGKEGLFADIIKYAKDHSANIEYLNKSFFENSLPKGNQGIVCKVIEKSPVSLQELVNNRKGNDKPFFFVVLDGIEDPRNLGAIIRIADATGVDAVIHQSHRSAGYSGYVSKSSSGAVEYVNLIETPNIKNILDDIKDLGVTIYGAEKGAQDNLWEVDLRRPLAIVIGSEGKGIRQSVKKLCEGMVSIPMFGNINSLNVSVATGILCYEVLRQRNTKR
ncbi:MAG: 23S rRNA (guanosine(2251)-2'-O)-methyltransferase RlmB [Thermodesulfovibrionales bacterium]|nr:23S rRNA (guanosine(2251)-2'-O)-methyltransferase RlmB [Thermodesulfovibrionales bacterium]